MMAGRFLHRYVVLDALEEAAEAAISLPMALAELEEEAVVVEGFQLPWLGRPTSKHLFRMQ